jgi:hypothetical protein
MEELMARVSCLVGQIFLKFLRTKKYNTPKEVAIHLG